MPLAADAEKALLIEPRPACMFEANDWGLVGLKKPDIPAPADKGGLRPGGTPLSTGALICMSGPVRAQGR